MASGFPDYFRGVDIVYNKFSEVTVRPKYGGGIRTLAVATVSASARTGLVSITGKGMIYGGFLRVDFTSSQKNSEVQLLIDGAEVAFDKFVEFNDYGISKDQAYPVVIQKYDDVNFIYCVGFTYGLTFEASFKVSYDEKHGVTPEVECAMVYTLI